MDLETLPTPPRPSHGGFFRKAVDDTSAKIADAVSDAMRRAANPTPAEVVHRLAEHALLAAAVDHAKAQADLKGRGGVLAVRNAAAHYHSALDRAAVAYANAHALLVAES